MLKKPQNLAFRFCVCTRSGVSGDSLPTSDNKFVKQTCIKYLKHNGFVLIHEDSVL